MGPLIVYVLLAIFGYSAGGLVGALVACATGAAIQFLFQKNGPEPAQNENLTKRIRQLPNAIGQVLGTAFGLLWIAGLVVAIFTPGSCSPNFGYDQEYRAP